MVGRNRVVPYKFQKYDELRAKHQQLGTLFTDPIFPPTNLSVYQNKAPIGNITWKRPQELCDNPSMFLENEQVNILQGKLGKTWFTTACYALSNAHELWNRVIPNYRDQVWDLESSSVNGDGETPENVKRKYAGIFHFQFWRFGKWVDVVIDDMLPVLSVNPTAPPSPSSSPDTSMSTDTGLPLFTRSCQPNEMWVSLVEKAYAKLLGSYEALENGTLKDVLVDFTGGVSEELSWKGEKSEECKQQIFRTLFHEMHEHSLVCCAVAKSEDVGGEETRTEIGLVRGRTYILSSVKKIHLANSGLKTLLRGREKIGMIRLKDPMERNAAGQEPPDTERDGDNAEGETCGVIEEEADSGVYVYPTSKLRRLFSKSPEWARVNNSQLTRMGLVCQASNEFWIPWDDLANDLYTLTICRLFNTNVFALGRTWKEKIIFGYWSRGAKGTSADRSGGGTPEQFPDTFLRNPQYLFDVTIQEEEVVIQLIQWPLVTQVVEVSDGPLAIAIHIFQVEENRKYRMHTLLDCCPVVVECGPISAREIYYRGHIVRGRYLLVPSTAVCGDSANYFLRVFSSNADIKLRELKKDYPTKWECSPLSCCVPSPLFITSVTIRHAEELHRQKGLGSCNPYCVVICEGSKGKTPVMHNTREPVWDTSFIFYRYKIEKPIVIKVYSHNVCMPDNYLGETSFPAPVNHQKVEIRADLINPKEKVNIDDGRTGSVDSAASTKGSITVEILTEDDAMTL